ncbi:hypothetical protein EDD93_6526 [Streptomyces sp. 840.1]|nr:hypothetical protein EDD93_6526 [Streptomyces sp. 840.1]
MAQRAACPKSNGIVVVNKGGSHAGPEGREPHCGANEDGNGRTVEGRVSGWDAPLTSQSRRTSIVHQLVNMKYFQLPCVVELTVSPDAELTYEERTRARTPDLPEWPRLTADFPLVPSLKYSVAPSYHLPW